MSIPTPRAAARLLRSVVGLYAIGACLGCGGPEGGPAPKPAVAPKAAAWSYTGDTGPSHWGELSPAYVLAKTGKEQSPVNIVQVDAIPTDLPTLSLSYHATTLEILNNGHTVEDDYHGGGTLTVDGHAYKLAQFHFHSPSEHTIDGKHTPLEMHLVHRDASGKLAVVGVMIEEGDAHPELALVLKHMPTTPGRSVAVEGVQVDASRLLPASLESFRYPGSLTTPPCSEQVAWFVLKRPIQASKEQIAAFRNVISGNNRPTQPLHKRIVSTSK